MDTFYNDINDVGWKKKKERYPIIIPRGMTDKEFVTNYCHYKIIKAKTQQKNLQFFGGFLWTILKIRRDYCCIHLFLEYIDPRSDHKCCQQE